MNNIEEYIAYILGGVIILFLTYFIFYILGFIFGFATNTIKGILSIFK